MYTIIEQDSQRSDIFMYYDMDTITGKLYHVSNIGSNGICEKDLHEQDMFVKHYCPYRC